ncbi:immunity 22 family protein [Mastigocoleus testarum]|uniref:immunity 22 family protein n=1 Tax=Mastigocoleus testarum TaxID=996925 RepID=UPI00042135A1|nr:immunity 22 family protein [Mastigocoleus testarum]
MEEVGIVSLWLGKTDSLDSLENILQIFYSEDGDFAGSTFTKAFEIDFYDEDFREAEFLAQSDNNIEGLLKGFSYDSVIIPRFAEFISPLNQNFNTVILLFNFRYTGTVKAWETEELYLEYFGSVSYIN